MNDEYKEKERNCNRDSMKRIRNDDEYRKKERESNIAINKKLRMNKEYTDKERRVNQENMRELRNDKEYRGNEKKSDKIQKQNKRDSNLYRFRENFQKNLARQNSLDAELQLQFIKDRSLMPELVCCCCEGLFFIHSVINFKFEKIKQDFSDDFFGKIFNFNSIYICKTCNIYVRKGKVPKLAVSNGLKFAEIPECVKMLSSLEERMVAPYINFMQLRPLKSFMLNAQLGMKGSVVNIPVEINDMLQVLPRNFDNMATIQIKLKRHMLHSSDYMFETIRPAVVCDALKHLLDTPLYQKHHIKIDEKYFHDYESRYDENLNFVIDQNDLEKDINSNSQNSLNQYFNEPFDIDEVEIDDEVLVVDRNNEVVNNVKIMAPGQGKAPVAWHLVEDLDELCFPKIFGGYKLNIPSNITYHDRSKSESRRQDRRSCIPSRILFMAKKKLEKACIASLNMCLRKSKRTNGVSVADVLNIDFINNLTKLDEGYKILKQIRSSPSYWESRKKELMAMIRQLGKPTIFLTLSAGERIWPELIKTLVKLNRHQNISLEEALNLSDNEKTELIRNDPVTCARYFDYKANKFMRYLKQADSVFKEYLVLDSYERVEFQMRGSPHEHIFLWLKDAPIYDSSKPNSVDQCIQFIDRFITCKYDENDPFMMVQKHKHTHTCYKGKKNKTKCRFNFPIPVMPRTMILEPLSDKDENMKKNLTEIRKYMTFLSKKQEYISFEDILLKLNLTEQQYILALRSSLKRTQLFLKRNSLETVLNGYNKTILHMFESNMDIQFIFEEYGLASYIINYISKVDAGLSKLLRDAASDIHNGHNNIKDKFRKITNVFLNSNLMSAQEASYHVLSLPLSKSSRQTIFINTSLINERALMLKSNKELRKLNENSTEIYMADIMTKYSKRPVTLENICLADFAAKYNKIANNRNLDENEDNLEVLYKNKKKEAIIRYRRYKLVQDPVNYFREQVLLFLPWRNELNEVENVNCENTYNSNKEIVEENRKIYLVCADEVLDEALVDAQNDNKDVEEEEIDDFNAEILSREQQIDILEQDGKALPKEKQINRFTCPTRVSNVDLLKLMYNLNSAQREFVMHILNSFKIKNIPIRIFLSGSAGVGKSTVINCLYQLITNYFDNIPGANKDKLVVLLCAPSGKAAFLINGVTLHTAFALPVSQFGGNMPELSSDMANSIREKLIDVKFLIIDEISMVGSTLFSRVDTRLRQIMGINESFGGISVIIVGDLNQLPPVMDSAIYKTTKSNEMDIFFDRNPLWDEFSIYELTEIMRQKNELEFIQALNNLAIGKMTVENINLIKSRKVDESTVPDSAIRLFAENINVDLFNYEKIAKFPGIEYQSEAIDTILGKVSNNVKTKCLESLKSKKSSEVNGLPYLIKFKIGIKYMITSNIDVEDGLVNGACGTLKFITFEPNSTQPNKIWLDFNSKVVGNKARLSFKDYMKSENIDKELTPIVKSKIVLNISKKLQYQTIRKQFPVVPAEAITIHKSQGQSYEQICIDFNRSRRITRSMMYVALSRVTKLSGLYIIGEFRPPKLTKLDNPTLSELTRLRTDKQIILSYNTLKETKGIKIIYQNICSLSSKLKYILKDDWYQRGEILIFSETLTNIKDTVYIPNYNIVFRSNISGGSRGIICYVKNNVTVENIKHVLNVSQNGNSPCHVEFISFQIEKYFIITGYKSPSTSHSMFDKSFHEILNKTSISNNNIVVMGDFNFDMRNTNNNSFLNNFFGKFSLISALPLDTVTTENNTQIDVIFSTSNKINTCVYETYFSYHKPIVAILNNNEINKVVNSKLIPEIESYNLSQNKDNEIKFTPIAQFDISTFIPDRLIQSDINTVLNPEGFLEDLHIDIFGRIVAAHTNLRPQSTNYAQVPERIQPILRGTPHLQILFSSNLGKIGHWICTYYDGNVNNIYDSFNQKALHPDHVLYLKRLYGDNVDHVFHDVQRQTNGYDCGVFAMAFATSLCFGRDPVIERYEIKLMRKHAAKILTTKSLTLFPLQ